MTPDLLTVADAPPLEACGRPKSAMIPTMRRYEYLEGPASKPLFGMWLL